jgi:murein DD-endopeptidase MepM/ murein hydrolase activator NlpD
MSSLKRPSSRALGVALAAVLVCAVALVVALRTSPASAAGTDQLQQQISAGQSKISGLAGAVSAASGQIAQLQASIAPLQAQLVSIQSDLDAKRAELLQLQSQLSTARTRLASLEAFEARGESVLAKQLVNAYESDRPDLISVVLDARGFTDLLERVAFASRIRNQDAQVVGQVRSARRQVAAEATRLGSLEARQQTLTAGILSQRNSLARTRLNLVQRQLTLEQGRSAEAGQLATVRGQVASLQDQLAKAQAAQAAQAAHTAQASSAGFSSSGPVAASQVSSGGGFTFPMPKGAASPPGTWSPDDGVDISAPAHTPLLAVGSGTIVLHGIGGFGPSAPVLHLDSGPYVYYGHAGPGNWVPIGTHVSAGQVISEVGAGIVGISTGPHLELGFCDSSGNPIGPSSAPRMLALLQAAY